METLELYVKQCSNCEGMPLVSFQILGPTWEGASIQIPFGEGEEIEIKTVIGMTSLFCGKTCPIHVVKAKHQDNAGYLLYGADNGVRILDEEGTPLHEGYEGLKGYGMPIIWVDEPDDIPESVREVTG